MVIIRLESIFPFITAHLQVIHGTPVFPGTQYEKHYPSGLIVMVHNTMLTERDPIIFKFKRQFQKRRGMAPESWLVLSFSLYCPCL